MKVSTSTSSLDALDVDGVAIGVFEDLSLSGYTGDLTKYIEAANFKGKSGDIKILYTVDGFKAPKVALVGMGDKSKSTIETARVAAGKSTKALRKDGAKRVAIPSFENAQGAAEGALLGLYRLDELKTMNPESRPDLEELIFSGSEEEFGDWEKGQTIAHAQNFARRLGELPSNIATPTFFVEETKKQFEGVANVNIEVYDEEWAKSQKMGAFLSVAKGSHEPAKFMVINYQGGKEGDKPYAIVGKGITFDSGGISLKPSSGMGSMRGDCSGAAATIGALLGIAKLKLPINAVGITPLTENMPGGGATKPADVVFASNGKSIEVDNTDAEGRMILSDGLVYTEKTFEPHTIVDIATLTGAMNIALGEHYMGAFTRSDDLWKQLEESGKRTNENFWRMPLDDRYKKQLKSSLADLKNVGGRPAGSITAAMFLSEFVEMERWVHLDIAGSAWPSSEGPYVPKGNAGVPVRALIDLANSFTK